MNQRRANVTVNVFAEKTAIYVLDDNNETRISVSLDVSPIKVFVGDASGDFVTYAEVIKLLNESDGVTTVHNAQRLGGYPADHYPRKAENALITGAWRHTGPLALGGNFFAEAALHNEGESILGGNTFLGGDMVSRGGAQAGFSGYGLWYRKEDNHLMIDNLTVRKAMRVYELIVNQIRGTNGSLWVSDTVKIVSAEETATVWRCFIDTNDASSIVPFREGDLIRSQRWTGKGVKYYSSKVVATATDFFELDKETWDGWDIPEAEDVLVRFGNVDANSDRQGALYLTSSDTDAPYMDVIDGVDSFSLAGKTKVRLGRLNGIFYSTVQLSGYGLYGENSFLTGKLLVGDLTKQGQYMEYANGQLTIRGKITVTGGNAATKSDVDAVQVGGRNLFFKSGFSSGRSGNAVTGWGVYGATLLQLEVDKPFLAPGVNAISWVISSGVSNGGYYQRLRSPDGGSVIERFKAGEQYTVSAWIKASEDANIRIHVEGLVTESITATTEWKKYSLTFTGDDIRHTITFYGYTQGVRYYLCMPKLELGNRATDWAPAPEDVTAYVDAVQVGGRNLLRNTNKGTTNWAIDTQSGTGTWTTSASLDGGIDTVLFTKTVHTASGWAVPKITAIPPSKLSANADYVVSFYAKSNFEASGTVNLSTHINTPLANSPSVNIPPSESWVKITAKITTLPNYDALVSGEGTIVIRMPATGATAAGNYIQFKNVKLELGNRATDWTPAPEDVDAEIASAKQEALTAAAAAQTAASTANATVGDLYGYVDGAFKDGVIDAAEAKAIEKYKNTLNEAMAKAESSYSKVYANTYLSGAPKTALQNAKINLWGQRDTLISAINTAISGGTTTPAQKANVDSAFGTFNMLMRAFQNALEDANKAIQVKLDDISKGYVDAVQVGGRNLFFKSGFSSGTSGNAVTGWGVYGATLLQIENDKPFSAPGVNAVSWVLSSGVSNGGCYQRLLSPDGASVTNYFQQGRSYTVSAWIKASAPGTLRITAEGVSGGTAVLSLTTEWQLYTHTFIGDPIRHTIAFYGYTQGVRYYLCMPKLELGNRATDWTPAPEDVPSALDYLAKAIQDGKTDIEGGLVTTNILKVKDTAGAVKGGMSGLKSDNVGFWTGGTYQEAINGNANVIFRKDGSFSLAGGKISGTASGNVTIDGSLITKHITTNYIQGLELNFSKGKIGGFSIGATDLVGSNLKISPSKLSFTSGGTEIGSLDYGNGSIRLETINTAGDFQSYFYLGGGTSQTYKHTTLSSGNIILVTHNPESIFTISARNQVNITTAPSGNRVIQLTGQVRIVGLIRSDESYIPGLKSGDLYRDTKGFVKVY